MPRLKPSVKDSGTARPPPKPPQSQSQLQPQPPARSLARRARPKAGGRATLGPEDWIREAEKLLVDKSIDGVRVDVLASRLQVTRGSFYHHFADRSDLLVRLLHYWRERQTEQVMARHEKQSGRPQKVIRELTELPFHGNAARLGSSVELAIRAWARRDEIARGVVEDVDRKRLAHIVGCFRNLGFVNGAAKVRAFMLYGYMQSESIFRTPGTEAEKAERRRFVADILMSKDLP